MPKKVERNEDWIKRDHGRIRTKGAMAAERASAGLGTSDDDVMPLMEPAPLQTVWAKRPPKSDQPAKQ